MVSRSMGDLVCGVKESYLTGGSECARKQPYKNQRDLFRKGSSSRVVSRITARQVSSSRLLLHQSAAAETEVPFPCI